LFEDLRLDIIVLFYNDGGNNFASSDKIVKPPAECRHLTSLRLMPKSMKSRAFGGGRWGDGQMDEKGKWVMLGKAGEEKAKHYGVRRNAKVEMSAR